MGEIYPTGKINTNDVYRNGLELPKDIFDRFGINPLSPSQD